MKEDLKQRYKADFVARFEKNIGSQRKRIQHILKHIDIRKTDVVGDFGCGNGLLFESIINKVKTYYGIDFSQDIMDSFERLMKEEIAANETTLFVGDIVDFPKKHTSILDSAFTLDFSEHIYDDQFLKIYSAIGQSLKPSGKLYLHTPNGNFLIEILKNQGIMKQLAGHVAVRNMAHYRKLLTQAGFQKIEVKYIPHYTILKHLHLLSFIPFIGKFFEARLLITAQKTDC